MEAREKRATFSEVRWARSVRPRRRQLPQGPSVCDKIAASSDCSRPVNDYVHIEAADLCRPNARFTQERQGYQVLTLFGKLGYSRVVQSSEILDEWRAVPAERGEVGGLVVGRPILPAPKENPDPFEGQRAEGGVVAVAPSALLVVVAPGPGREADGLTGVFVKRLLQELRTGEAVMHPAGLAAAYGDRGDAGVGLERTGGLPAGAVGPEGGRQAGRVHRTRPRQTHEEVVVGVIREDRGDGGIKGPDRVEERAQLRGVGLDGEAEGVDDRGVGGQRLGRGDLREPVVDDGGPATVVLLIEPSHRGGARPLDGGQRRPLPQEVATLARVEGADPVEGLGKIRLYPSFPTNELRS